VSGLARRLAQLEARIGISPAGSDRVSVIILQAAYLNGRHDELVTGMGNGCPGEHIPRFSGESVADLKARAVPLLASAERGGVSILSHSYANLEGV